MSKPSKAAIRAQKQIAKYATGDVRIDNPGGHIEEVRGVIHKHRIEVTVQGGIALGYHACPAHLRSDSSTDYFPGSWCNSLAGAIRLCLPARYRSWYDAHGVVGQISMNLCYSGAGFKDMAIVRLLLAVGDLPHTSCITGANETRHVWRSWDSGMVKGGQLLDGIRHAYDTGDVFLLVDYLIENNAGFAAVWEEAVAYAESRQGAGVLV